MKVKGFFVTSTGTELGKTYLSTKLISNFFSKNIIIDFYKPILSGFDLNKLNESDTAKLLKAGERVASIDNIKKITPWIFKKALAPSIAAKHENKKLSFDLVKKWCLENKKNSKCQYLLFEGAGGIMVPIERKKTFIDLFKALKIPVILVSGSYLGTVSHTLSALETLAKHNIKIINIIFNEGKKLDENYQDNYKLLKSSIISNIKIRPLAYRADKNNTQIKVIADDIIKYFNRMA